jgi:farnesyl-diphosphate farnesyltransferase
MELKRDSESHQTLPAVAPAERERLLTDLLKGVSRAFYLTLRVLPRGLREPIGLAYLLARAADTIADTRLLPPDERLNHLLGFRAQVRGPANLAQLQQLALSLTSKQSIPKERELLAALPQAFSLLEALPEADRARVRSIVVTLTRGMEIDLTTFPHEDSGMVSAFKDWDALDSYTYYVAGCVGEFWTAIAAAHVRALRHWDVARMSEVGVRFGKALQFTNVLRDVPRDLRIGRCYLPREALAQAGVTPEGLRDPATGPLSRPALAKGIELALEHYRAAETYLLAIPRRCLRLRLAVAWPILIGLATLAVLARNQAWLDPTKPSKVSRGWVYRMMALSLPAVLSNTLTRAWIARLRRRVQAAL